MPQLRKQPDWISTDTALDQECYLPKFESLLHDPAEQCYTDGFYIHCAVEALNKALALEGKA